MKVLGIDVGTEGSRALVMDDGGRIVSSATEEHAPFASPKIGWAEQHPENAFTIFEEMKVPVKSIRLGGGGARSKLWRQIQADVYGHEVEIVEAEEGAAYGAAIQAGVGAEIWPSVDAACERTVRVKERVPERVDVVQVMNDNYTAYQRVYAATKGVFNS